MPIFKLERKFLDLLRSRWKNTVSLAELASGLADLTDREEEKLLITEVLLDVSNDPRELRELTIKYYLPQNNIGDED